jgi:hypothetical protein
VVSVRAGVRKLGCLVALLVLVVAVYLGFNVGEVYVRYYRFLDGMKQQARFARQIDDETIRLRLASLADSLGLPDEAERVRVRRSANRIEISASYEEAVDLPLSPRTVRFDPRVETEF